MASVAGAKRGGGGGRTDSGGGGSSSGGGRSKGGKGPSWARSGAVKRAASKQSSARAARYTKALKNMRMTRSRMERLKSAAKREGFGAKDRAKISRAASKAKAHVGLREWSKADQAAKSAFTKGWTAA